MSRKTYTFKYKVIVGDSIHEGSIEATGRLVAKNKLWEQFNVPFSKITVEWPSDRPKYGEGKKNG